MNTKSYIAVIIVAGLIGALLISLQHDLSSEIIESD